MTRLFLLCLLPVTMALALCSRSFASHPLITDDTGTQGKGKFQLEVNGGYGHDEDDGVTTKTTQISTTLAYGLSDAMDLMIGLPYDHTRIEDSGTVINQDGISDTSLEMKWRFFDKDGLSFALKPGMTFPTGDDQKGLGSGRMTYHLFFIGTKEIKPWAFYLNLGYIRNENTLDENRDLWHASLASTVEVTTNLKLVGNIGLERSTRRNLNIPNAFILGGVIYSLSENFDIDFGVKGGLTKPEEDYTLLVGLTWRF
jgi:long-subunit fatty acid transport protein